MSSDSESTTDLKEVEHFSNLKDSWWDTENGPLAGLHSMNNVRIPFIKDQLISAGVVSADTKPQEFLKGLRILDVGCGGGFLSEPLARMGAEVTGIDPSDLIKIAKTHAALDPTTKPIRYIQCSIEDHITENQNFYDIVIGAEVLDHAVNPELFIKSCVAVLKPGGCIYLSTINRTFFSWLYVIFMAENVFKAIPKGTHTYGKFITPQEVQAMLEEYNCKTIQIHGCWPDFLNQKRYVSWFKGTFYGVFAVKSAAV